MTPEDIKAVAVLALAHRLVLRPEMWVRQVTGEDVAREGPGRGARPAEHPVKRHYSARTDQVARPARRPVARSAGTPAPRARSLATAALLALLAAVLTGHAALLLLAAPGLGALALMPRRPPPG